MDKQLQSIHTSELYKGNTHTLARRLLFSAMTFIWICGMFASLIAFRTYDIYSPEQNMDYVKRCVLGFAIAAPLILITCQQIAGKLWSKQMLYVITLLCSLIFVGIAINMAGYLSANDASWANPGLSSYSDSAVQYDLSKRLTNGEQLPGYCSVGFPLFESFLIYLDGGGIFIALLFNAICMTVSACLCGVITCILLPKDDVRKKAWVSALLFAIIPSIPYYGAMFLKEAPVTLGFTLQTAALAYLYRGQTNIPSLAGALIGAILLTFIKPHLGYITGLGVTICIYNLLIHKHLTRKVLIRQALPLATIAILIVVGGRWFRASDDFVLLNTDNAEGNTTTMMHHDTLGNYSDITGDYYAKSPAERVLYLPLTAVAQYFPPFPWNFNRDTHLGKFVPVAHISWLWYLVGGLVIAYFALCLPFRHKRQYLGLWAIYWLICYLGVAYMSAGTVARYYLPFMAVCIPLAVQVLQYAGNGRISRTQYYIYSATYITLVSTGLAIAYIFLH